MTTIFKGFLLFCMYALLVRYHYVCKITHHCDGESKVSSLRNDRMANVSLFSNDNKTIFTDFEQFIFEQATVDPVISPNNQTFLNKVAEYMQQNTHKMLTLTGGMRWGESDIKPKGFDDIGMARAASIKKMLIERGVPENKIQITSDINPKIDGSMTESMRFSVQE
jgi:hypothetical protein